MGEGVEGIGGGTVGQPAGALGNSLTTAEGDIDWVASEDEAHALPDGGKTAEVQLTALRAGENTHEYKGTKGFMITFDLNSKDVAMAADTPMTHRASVA